MNSEQGQISYNFGEYNGIKVFNNKEEFIKFLNDELGRYLWLSDENNELYKNIYQQFNETLSYLKNNPLINKLDGNIINEGRYNRGIHHLYKHNAFPLSSTAIFTTIESMRENNPNLAVSAIRFLLNHNFSINNRDDLCAAIILSQHFNQFIKLPSSIRGSLKTLVNEFNQKIADGKKFQDELISENEELKKKRRADILARYKKLLRTKKEHIKNTEIQVNSTIKQLTDKSAKAIEDIHETRLTYLQFMQLQAPAEYWRNKHKEHKKAAKKWGIWLSVFGSVGGALLIYGLYRLASHVLSVATDNKPFAVYFIYAIMAVTITTLVFWGGRILSRLCLSQYHLALDAGERAIMAQTYLALTKDGTVDAEDRTLVLGALFRPTEDGIVRDDATPDLSQAAILSKLIMPKGGS